MKHQKINPTLRLNDRDCLAKTRFSTSVVVILPNVGADSFINDTIPIIIDETYEKRN